MERNITNKVLEEKALKENLFDFRERMCNSFSDVEIKLENKNKSAYCFSDVVRYSVIDSEVVETALLDLDKFFKKININLVEDNEAYDLLIQIDENIFGGETGNGFILNVQKNKITITGNNERGVCQGIYYVENLIVNNSCLPIGTYTRRARFSPRMIHSGYELDVFPDEYLSVIAHNGFDAIVVFAKSTNRTAIAELDFNQIVKKAKKYGIDFYVYSYVNIFVSPFDKNAKEIYDERFGGMFRDCPDIKGIILIGESNQFPSIDENTEQYSLFDALPEGKLPHKKPSSGWWPCSDYPQWVALIRDSIRKYSKDADIVLWTYNWGFTPSKYRKALIENLPTDISVCVTWDMNQREKIGDIYETIPDYGIQVVGPSPNFIDEAEIAKRRGIKLYAMTNTCGRTWDFGGIPYMPMMYQWADRCEKLVEAQEKYGLSGLLESHHYGFFPSFISELNNSFFMDGEKNLKAIDIVSKRIAKEGSMEFKKAMRKWSNAMKNYVTTDEDQYGPCRVGTAYPLCLKTSLYPPQDGGVLFGCAIYRTVYNNMDSGKSSPFSMRIRPEIKRFTRMAELMKEGIDILSNISTRTKELDRIQNIGEYLYHCVITVINVKKFWIQRMALLTATTKRQIETAIMKIEQIASEEIENAKDSIKNLELDSSLGYEASMGYQADSSRVLWKIEQVKYMLEVEIGKYKEAISITLETDGNNYYRF